MTAPIHLPTLFDYLRRAPFGGRLSATQVSGIERLMAACAEAGITDDRHVSYVLASVFHETGARMQPVRETFATSDAQAIRRLDAAMAAGRLRQVRRPYWRDGWFGRGDIQVTHERNYRRMGEVLGVDLVAQPALLLDPAISARATAIGMRDGLYTGRKLADYFNATVDDPEGARRIVNGTDKASLIAGYHRAIWDSFLAARREGQKAVVAAAPAPVADGPDLKTDQTAIGGVLAGLGGLGGIAAAAGPVLQGVTNVWALLALLVVLVGVGLVLTGRLKLKLQGGV
jgi:predicted chitinase